MTKRRNVRVAGFAHVNPVPAAARIGNMVVSGGIHGLDPATGKLAPTIEAQCAQMFTHVRAIIAAAGGTPDDIIKMTVWMADRTQRDILNREWISMFPDEHSRPARHTMRGNLENGMLVQCDFTAILDSPS